MKGNTKSGPGTRRGRPCSICRHVDRRRIELACASGRSHNDVAAEFGLSRFAINRHWASHVTVIQKEQYRMGPELEISKLAERAAAENRSLIEYLGILRSQLLNLFMEAKDTGNLFAASHVAKTLLACLEAVGKVTGELRSAGITINNVNAGTVGHASPGPTLIMSDPQVIRLQATIISALSAYPEAKSAVILALHKLDAQPIGKGLNGSHGAPMIEGTAANA
jgi:hypothetical protein